MKTIMIAALAAAQLAAVAGPARAADLGREEMETQRPGPAADDRLVPTGGSEEAARDGARQSLALIERTDLREGQAAPFLASDVSSRSAAAQDDEPRKKRKSTGDKVLTGAAVILGVGALAVGGLLVAIFVN